MARRKASLQEKPTQTLTVKAKAVTFKQKAFRILPDNRVMLRLPRTYSRREIILEYRLSPKDFLGEVKQVKLVFSSQTSDWYLHIVHRVSVKYREPGNIMALDLGIVNIAAGILSTGQTFLVPGGALLALDRYFHKEIAKCRSSSSRRSRNLNRKWSRQRKHYLHALTRWIVDYAAGNNVSVIVVEELKGIRSDANWGDRGNQKLHAWPYRKIIRMLTYKAALKGIRVVDVSEKDTSITCPICRRRAKSARVMRGLFRHCGCLFNADMVGAYNILQRYLQEAGQPASGVVGGLARPAVNLFVWRKTTPQGREQGTFRQTA
ncbi:putative transposase [Thermincola ferriacetica]|uniref:Putative transposase n=1 Tax=Thermincola ferriacetica TaxID=281456 RepID=A0A0L6W460_9FIRM|nr:RNA-guided endonuclease TnpB family protein [Thermincola ferriacetica]KNZ70320.1 putative transposase [Thermincola ferriacetica]